MDAGSELQEGERWTFEMGKQTLGDDDESISDQSSSSSSRDKQQLKHRTKKKKKQQHRKEKKGVQYDEDVIDGFAILSFQSWDELKIVTEKSGHTRGRHVSVDDGVKNNSVDFNDGCNHSRKRKSKKVSQPEPDLYTTTTIVGGLLNHISSNGHDPRVVLAAPTPPPSTSTTPTTPCSGPLEPFLTPVHQCLVVSVATTTTTTTTSTTSSSLSKPSESLFTSMTTSLIPQSVINPSTYQADRKGFIHAQKFNESFCPFNQTLVQNQVCNPEHAETFLNHHHSKEQRIIASNHNQEHTGVASSHNQEHREIASNHNQELRGVASNLNQKPSEIISSQNQEHIEITFSHHEHTGASLNKCQENSENSSSNHGQTTKIASNNIENTEITSSCARSLQYSRLDKSTSSHEKDQDLAVKQPQPTPPQNCVTGSNHESSQHIPSSSPRTPELNNHYITDPHLNQTAILLFNGYSSGPKNLVRSKHLSGSKLPVELARPLGSAHSSVQALPSRIDYSVELKHAIKLEHAPPPTTEDNKIQHSNSHKNNRLSPHTGASWDLENTRSIKQCHQSGSSGVQDSPNDVNVEKSVQQHLKAQEHESSSDKHQQHPCLSSAKSEHSPHEHHYHTKDRNHSPLPNPSKRVCRTPPPPSISTTSVYTTTISGASKQFSVPLLSRPSSGKVESPTSQAAGHKDHTDRYRTTTFEPGSSNQHHRHHQRLDEGGDKNNTVVQHNSRFYPSVSKSSWSSTGHLYTPAVYHTTLAPSLHHTSLTPAVHHASISPLVHHSSLVPSVHHSSISPLVHHTSLTPSVNHSSLTPFFHHAPPLTPTSTSIIPHSISPPLTSNITSLFPLPLAPAPSLPAAYPFAPSLLPDDAPPAPSIIPGRMPVPPLHSSGPVPSALLSGHPVPSVLSAVGASLPGSIFAAPAHHSLPSSLSHPSISGRFHPSDSLLPGQNYLHQDLNSRLLSQHNHSTLTLQAPAPRLAPQHDHSVITRPSPVPLVHSETHQHQHLHSHMHQHQHTFGGMGSLGPPVGSLMVPGYRAAFTSLLPTVRAETSSLASGLQGAFQPKSLMTSPDQMFLSFREREKAVSSSGLPPAHKKHGKWCSVHVKVAWEIYHRQHKKLQKDVDVGTSSSTKQVPDPKPVETLLGSALPASAADRRATDPSLIVTGARVFADSIAPTTDRFLPSAAPVWIAPSSDRLMPPSTAQLGLSNFPRPSTFAASGLANPLSLSGLGSSILSTSHDLAPQSLSTNGTDWRNLQRPGSMLPSLCRSDGEMDRERELRKEEERERRRSASRPLSGIDDIRRPESSRSRSRSPLVNGGVDLHNRPDISVYDKRLKEDNLSSLSLHLMERGRIEREKMDREQAERERVRRERLEKERLYQSVAAAASEKEKLLQAYEQREKCLHPGGYLGLNSLTTAHPGLLDRRVGLIGLPATSYPFFDRPQVPTSLWSPFDKSADLSQRLELERERERLAVMSHLSGLPPHLTSIDTIREQILREQQDQELDIHRHNIDRLASLNADRVRTVDPISLGSYFPQTLPPMFGPSGLVGLKNHPPNLTMGLPPPLIQSNSTLSYNNSPSSSSSKSKDCNPTDSTSDLKILSHAPDTGIHIR